jgi:hypothetical protein
MKNEYRKAIEGDLEGYEHTYSDGSLSTIEVNEPEEGDIVLYDANEQPIKLRRKIGF